MALVIGPVSVSAAEMPSVTYQTHVQNVGWQDYVAEGKMSGTEGMSYRLGGIRIALDILLASSLISKVFESDFYK